MHRPLLAAAATAATTRHVDVGDSYDPRDGSVLTVTVKPELMPQ